jgi:4-amino-4-deoxy-L-arabinose transferase-like glycosyltransferase
VHGAQRIAGGEVLYRDIAAFTGPLPFELLALLFRVFGDEIWVARIAVAVLHGAACAAIYGVGNGAGGRILGSGAAALHAAAAVLLVPFLSIYFYVTVALSLGCLATYAAVRGTRSVGWAILAGVLVAGVALCKQTLGVVFTVALLTAMIACAPRGGRPRSAFAAIGGGAAVAVVTLVAFALRGGLDEMVRFLVVVPLSFGETFRAPWINFWPPGRLTLGGWGESLYMPWAYAVLRNIFIPAPPAAILATQLLFALPFLAVAVTLLRRLTGPLPAAVWIHGAALIAAASNLFPRADWGHLAFVLPAAAVQTLLALGALRSPGRSPLPLRIGVGILSCALVAGCVLVGTVLYRNSEPPKFGPRVPFRAVSGQNRNPALPRVIRYLRKNTEPGEAIFVARGEPLLYYATDTRNPTPYSGVIPAIREEQERAILAGLEEVRYVVMSDIDQPLFNYYRDELPKVQAYLERHFRVPPEFRDRHSDWLLVLVRGLDRGEAFVDLVDAQASGRRWKRDGEGVEQAASSPPKLAVRHNRRPLAFWMGPGGGGIDFDLEIPERALFEADVGFPLIMASDSRFEQAPRVLMRVAIREAESFEPLREDRLVHDLTPRWTRIDTAPGRHWVPMVVDLRRYAGRRVTLRLEAIPEAPYLPEVDRSLAWWGSPRIVKRSD